MPNACVPAAGEAVPANIPHRNLGKRISAGNPIFKVAACNLEEPADHVPTGKMSRRALLAGLVAAGGAATAAAVADASAAEKAIPGENGFYESIPEGESLPGAKARLFHHLHMAAQAMDEIAASTTWQVYLVGRSPFGQRRYMAHRFAVVATPEAPGRFIEEPVAVLDWRSSQASTGGQA